MRKFLAFGVLLAAVPALAEEPAGLRESSPVARQEMERFGICVANRSPEKAAQTLHMDFRSTTYRSALRNLARTNEDCFKRGRMSSPGLPFAGAIAERLMERHAEPINVRLARAVSNRAPTSRAPSDAIAICVVRTVPDEVAKLFATEVATPEEAAAAASLDFALKLCSQGQPRLEANVEGLRAMLATAAFRSTTAPPSAVERG